LGGAICSFSSTTDITTSSFSNCSGGEGGGAIHTNGITTISTSSFQNCSATHDGGAIDIEWTGTGTVHFSRFYQNTAGAGQAIHSYGAIDATHNWWGSNSDPSGLVSGLVTTTPWLVLRATATPASIATSWHSDIGAHLTFDSTGADTSVGGIWLPDGINSTFALVSGSGSVSPLTAGTAHAVAFTRFTPAGAGNVNISATVDDQTEYVSLRVAEVGPVPTRDSGNNDGDSSTTTGQVSTASGQASTSLAETLPLMTVTIHIGGDSKANQATVTGTKLSELTVTGTVQSGPASNMTPPPGIVYQYINLVPARYTSITQTVINFTVPQSWLDENRIAPGGILLYHRTVNGWEALPTRVLYTKDGTVSFSAQSAGFSLFAIAGMPTAAPPVVSNVPRGMMNSGVPEQPPGPAADAKVPITTQTTVPPASKEPAGSTPFPVVFTLIGTGCVGLVGGSWYVRRWWVRRQNPGLFAEYD
jgi:PGF-pre-PGF domain-containing protein